MQQEADAEHALLMMARKLNFVYKLIGIWYPYKIWSKFILLLILFKV